MAIRFDIKVFEQVKTAYMRYMATGFVETKQDLDKFLTYKPYLDADKELQNSIRVIKMQLESERKRIEVENKITALKRAEEAKQEKIAAKRAEKEAKRAKKEARKAKKEAKKIAQTSFKKDIAFYSGGVTRDIQRAQPRRIRGQVSPVANRLSEVKTFDDLKSLMCSSFVETVKTTGQLSVLRSTIIRYTKDHQEEQDAYLKIVAQRKDQLEAKTNVTHKPKEECKNPRAVIFTTPMGGLNKRY